MNALPNDVLRVMFTFERSHQFCVVCARWTRLHHMCHLSMFSGDQFPGSSISAILNSAEVAQARCGCRVLNPTQVQHHCPSHIIRALGNCHVLNTLTITISTTQLNPAFCSALATVMASTCLSELGLIVYVDCGFAPLGHLCDALSRPAHRKFLRNLSLDIFSSNTQSSRLVGVHSFAEALFQLCAECKNTLTELRLGFGIPQMWDKGWCEFLTKVGDQLLQLENVTLDVGNFPNKPTSPHPPHTLSSLLTPFQRSPRLTSLSIHLSKTLFGCELLPNTLLGNPSFAHVQKLRLCLEWCFWLSPAGFSRAPFAIAQVWSLPSLTDLGFSLPHNYLDDSMFRFFLLSSSSSQPVAPLRRLHLDVNHNQLTSGSILPLLAHLRSFSKTLQRLALSLVFNHITSEGGVCFREFIGEVGNGSDPSFPHLETMKLCLYGNRLDLDTVISLQTLVKKINGHQDGHLQVEAD